MVITWVFKPHYCHLAFEWLDFRLINFGLGRSTTWLFALIEGKMLTAGNFVKLCALYDLYKDWWHKIWLFELTALLISEEVWGKMGRRIERRAGKRRRKG